MGRKKITFKMNTEHYTKSSLCTDFCQIPPKRSFKNTVWPIYKFNTMPGMTVILLRGFMRTNSLVFSPCFQNSLSLLPCFAGYVKRRFSMKA